MAMRPSDDYDRDILDIIPERFDADADSHQARAGHRLRGIVTIVVAVIAVGAIVAAGLHFLGGRRGGGMGVPVIKADDRPIKVRPDDRGGMQVPNQDKLVYERMDQTPDSDPKVERLLPQAEAPKTPPRQAMPAAEPMPPPPVAAVPQRATAPLPAKPGEPPTTQHLGSVAELMKAQQIHVILANPYYDPSHAQFLASNTGAKVVSVAHQVGSRPGTDDYLAMVDYNIRQLVDALKSQP